MSDAGNHRLDQHRAQNWTNLLDWQLMNARQRAVSSVAAGLFALSVLAAPCLTAETASVFLNQGKQEIAVPYQTTATRADGLILFDQKYPDESSASGEQFDPVVGFTKISFELRSWP